jgi:hypothetical protein
MNHQSGKPATAPELDTRQAILEELDALLGSSGVIDEARAKRARKALQRLHGTAGDTGNGEEPTGDSVEHEQLDGLIENRLKTLRARIHKQVERRNRDYEKALGLMTVLEQAVRDNALQKAEQTEKQLLSSMENIPGLSEQRWRDIEARLHRARPQLRKLESWRHWGTTQAREELIEQVRQLAAADLPPNRIARTVREAREQWQAWDAAGDQAGKDLWLAFDQACEKAYAPCAAHFEKLKRQRAENCRQRRELIDKLNTRLESIDWKQPDWREIDKFVSQARRSYRRIGNVDYRQRKPLDKALGAVLEKYEAHLARERTHSYRAREKLVADIEALQGMDNLRDALDQLDKLKSRWEITVVETRKLENRLWKRYQAACDGIYRRRDAERSKMLAGRSENARQKQALIGELAAAAQADDEALLADAARQDRLLEQWRSIGQVPREQEKTLDKRWRDVQRQYRDAIAAARSRSQRAALDRLARRAALCDRWEQAVLAGAVIDTDAITSEWRSLPALSGDGVDAIGRRFERAPIRPDDATLAANLITKLDACLKLEVLLDLATPAEYQAERMAYQVARLNAALQKDRSALESPEDLVVKLLVTGAVPAEDAGAVAQRIRDCVTHYTSRS